MLYGTQRGGQMRHFRKDLKTATRRLGAVLDPFKSIIYTSIRARARRFIFFYFWLLSKATDFFDELWILVVASGEWWVFMCLKTADVGSEDVWGIMLTWRGRSLVHVHTARALFFIILIILKAKLIFLIYLISTPRRASCKIYQEPTEDQQKPEKKPKQSDEEKPKKLWDNAMEETYAKPFWSWARRKSCPKPQIASPNIPMLKMIKSSLKLSPSKIGWPLKFIFPF